MKKKQQIAISFTLSNWRVWAFPSFVIFAVVLATTYVLLPQFNELMDENEQVEERNDDLQQLVSKRTFLETQSAPDLRKKLELIEKVLPSNKPVFAFLSSIYAVAEQTEVEYEQLELAPGLLSTESAKEAKGIDKPGELADLPLTLVVDGNFNAYVEYLNVLDTMAPIVSISSLTLSGDISDEALAPADANDSVGSTIDIAVHYSLPPISLGKPNSPLQAEDPQSVEILRKLESFETYGEEFADINLLIDQERDDPFTF